MTVFIQETGAGQPLILLHGWGFNHHIWQPIIAPLAARWRVYQVDLPGHGQSEPCAYQLPILIEKLAARSAVTQKCYLDGLVVGRIVGNGNGALATGICAEITVS